jgi:3-phenylpropionate/trans-cinnamate dioxygenase ferredoxin subunit
MAKHVVAPVATMPPGTQHRVEVAGRAIAIFNVGGSYHALRDVCPHQGAALSAGTVIGSVEAELAGEYEYCAGRRVRCPWHGWEYDLETGQSSYDPEHDRVRAYEVSVESGTELLPSGRAPGPYVAETVPISVENDYVVVEV